MLPGRVEDYPDVLAARRVFAGAVRDAVLRAVARRSLEPVLAEEFLRVLIGQDPRR
jgi:hypothetical protein